MLLAGIVYEFEPQDHRIEGLLTNNYIIFK